MLEIISAKRSKDLSAYVLLTTIFVAALSCSHNTSSNFENEPERLESEIVSLRNPNIIIQPPTTFTWLPDSIRAYNVGGLKDFPLHETIQKAVTESLTRNGYEYQHLTDARKTLIRRQRKGKNIETKDLILVKNWKWDGANFGASGLLKEITLDNRSNQNVKDLKIRIGYLGTRGAKEGYWGPTSIFVIHDLLPATSVKTFKDINIGFRHPDESEENISILSVKTIIDDLLIAYTLVTKNEVNDGDVNKAYDITPRPPGNNLRINEYKKGTLIIDVIDSETRILVWRGAVKALTSVYIPGNTKQNRINLAVEKLVNNFITSNQKTK